VTALALIGFWLAAATFFPQTAQPETALSLDAIMSRVAANQDHSEAARKLYRCEQHTHVITSEPGQKVIREETADYTLLPTSTGTQVQLDRLTGRYWSNGKYEDFSGEPVPLPNSWDADYIRDVRMCLTGEKSRCDSGTLLFPLTSEEQKQYDFHLLGRETVGGRDAYHISFSPNNKNSFVWAGEAFIDATDFQPLRVFTNLSRRVPFTVRIMLGTDMPGFGYNVVYKRQPDGSWFPSSYGTEYNLRLFFRSRAVSVLMDTIFEPADLTTK